MDGLIFTFLPRLLEVGLGVGLPLLGFAQAIPRLQSWGISRAATRLQAKRQSDYVRDLEAYARESHQVICDLILDANSNTSAVALPQARESALYDLQRHLPSTLKES